VVTCDDVNHTVIGKAISSIQPSAVFQSNEQHGRLVTKLHLFTYKYVMYWKVENYFFSIFLLLF